MLVNLSEIEKNQILSRQLDVAHMEVETESGIVQAHKLNVEFKFRQDPDGYLMSYECSGETNQPCIRCGKETIHQIAATDLLALRKRVPEDHHLVLDDSEMNVYFWEKPKVDLMEMLKEIIELEMPAYPRHPEGDPACELSVQADTNDSEQSPFGSLARFLKD